MSWAAHELESYFLQKHVKARISYLAVLIGCFLPDLFTKLPVYGLNIGSVTLIKAHEPWKYHRGWPGVGFTHSFFFVIVVSLLVLAATKNRAWGLGILIGGFAHVLTDTGDSVGTMLFFPFTTQHYSIGMWAYASQEGRYGDASAYFSSFGGVWDLTWLAIALAGSAVFSQTFFRDNVAATDPAWSWMRRRFSFSDATLLAMYRAFFLYGACRIFAWSIWARFLNPDRGTQVLDLTWGGPSWVQKAPRFQSADTWLGFFGLTAIGSAGLLVISYAMWRTIGKRMWATAT